MTTNLLIYYPDVPTTATATATATEHTSYPLVNAATGPRTEIYKLAAEQTEDLVIDYDYGSARTVDHFGIIRADLLRARGCTRVTLRGSSSAYNPITALSPRAWYDASRGVTVDSANLVSSWNDNGSGNRDASQSTGANKPRLTRADSLENLCLYSQELDNVAWGKSAVSITTAATTNPIDGDSNAFKIVENTANTDHYLSAPNTADNILIGASARWSVYVKAAERTWCYIQPVGGISSTFRVINLSTGAQGTGSGTAPVVTDAGGGWWRVTFTLTTTSAAVANLNIGLATGNSTSGYLGDGTSGIYVFGPQIQYSVSSESYLEATTFPQYSGINGCRALWFDGTNDTLTQSLAQSDFFATQGKTVYAVFAPHRIVGNQNLYAGVNGYHFFRVSTATIRANNFDGSADNANSTIPATIGGTFVGTLLHDTSNISVSVNGETLVSTASGATTSLGDTQFIGSDSGGGYFGGKIAELIFFNSAHSSGTRAIVYEYLAAKYSRAPQFATYTLDDDTLIGPREEDLFNKFATSSSYQHWWVQFGVDTPTVTSDFAHSKHLIGTALDLDREPTYPSLSLGSAQLRRSQREGRITLKLRWEGITNALKNTIVESVTSKADTNPIVLHDQNNYALHGFKALHCSVTSFVFTPRTSAYGDLELEFEEAI